MPAFSCRKRFQALHAIRFSNMTTDELRAKVNALGPWYHDINLGDVKTGGWNGIRHVWAHIQTVRARLALKYEGANVLDLGSREGMWAFEAEVWSARNVVALELGVQNLLEKFLFCRAVRGSRVLPCYGADAERTDEFVGQFVKEFGAFDIVQHLGLLYHLKNPIRSLESCRRVMKTGGTLLLETAGSVDDRAVMLSNKDSKVYTDEWTYWAPTVEGLTYMLEVSGFSVVPESVSILRDDVPRICLLAKAV